MLGLYLQNRTLSLRELAPPSPEGGESIIRVRLAGVCRTDIELTAGYMPFTGVLGHEFVGEVVASPSPEWVGRLVVGEINAPCGSCEACLAGRGNHCRQRTVLGIAGRDGAFAELVALPTSCLHSAEGIAEERAVFAEPLAAACQILEQVSVLARDRVLVVGAGKLGQLVAQVLSTTGCRLTVAARHPWQRERLEGLGIDAWSPDELGGAKHDLAVEATGTPEGFAIARRGLRPRGALVLKSTYRGQLTVDAASLVVDEIAVYGSRCGPFERALALLRCGAVAPEDLIEARYPLSQAVSAVEHASRPGARKVLLAPD